MVKGISRKFSRTQTDISRPCETNPCRRGGQEPHGDVTPYTGEPMRVTRSGLISAVIGYGVGSIPTGLIVVRLAKGVDVREMGSGSTGATNVSRVLGSGSGAAVFALDALKGAVAVQVADWAGCTEHEKAVAAVTAMVGHSYPVWSGFRGGKSVATAFGGLLRLNPVLGLLGLGAGMAALGQTKTTSAASLTAAGGAVAAATANRIRGGSDAPLLFAIGAAAIIGWRHRANIRRLAANQEPRIGEVKRGVVAPAADEVSPVGVTR